MRGGEQRANSHLMKQKMPQAPNSQLAAMDFAKSPTFFKSIYSSDSFLKLFAGIPYSIHP